LLEDEFIECLSQSRHSWMTTLTLEVQEGLLPSSEYVEAHHLLAGRISCDRLTTALLLTRIAADDADARSSRYIARWLVTAGLVNADFSVTEVVHGLVLPVVRRVRRNGVPWPRWWDVHGLHHLFIELWIARQLATSQPEIVSEELRAIWQLPDDLINAMLANAPSADPIPLLPYDLLKTSTTGESTKLLQGFAALGWLSLKVDEWLPDYLPELADRPDLIEAVSRVRLRRELEHVVRRRLRDIDAETAAGLQTDFAAFDDELARFMSALTDYEAELLCEPTAGIAHRDKCLTAGRNVLDYSVLGDDALPARMEPGEPLQAAPLWMQDHVISGGARTFRTNVGPYSVWLFTADSKLAATDVEALGIPGQSYGLNYRVENNLAEIRLQLPLTVDDPGPALVAPFVYALDYANSAWQLLHLAAVGYVRLVALRLTPDGALLAYGSLILNLSSEMCEALSDHALTALRSLVGDDMQALLWRRGTDEPEDISFAAFHANEAAKGEDLLDEIAGEPPVDVQPLTWERFQDASRSLARARAALAAAAADDRHPPELSIAVDRAYEDRQRAREMARADSARLDRQAQRQAWAAALPDERYAFIHFFTKNGTLQAVHLTRSPNGASISPIHMSPIREDSLLEVVQEWVEKGRTATDWYQTLAALLGVLADRLVQALADELHAKSIRRLVISPTPPLDLLPLHAVPVKYGNEIRTLCEVFDEVTYIPTMRMTTAISARPVSLGTAALIVTHSGRGVPGFPPLRGPTIETKILRTLYPVTQTISEHDATPRSVLAAMTGSRVIHIATHAHTPTDKWASGLVLQGEKRSQAILGIGDILADGDLSETELVVLNACRTGGHLSPARVVQTLHGIEAAFLARGARNVISTLWEINDLIALAFAALLHASIADGEPPGQAFRKAVAYLRDQSWRSQVRSDASVARAEELLDRAIHDWREGLDLQTARNPLAWSAFKFTGIA
jgi:CHAT domain-containing protein